MRIAEARDTAFAGARTVTPASPAGVEVFDGAAALIGRDPERVVAFIERELGPVEALGARAERLLETLEVFLKHGQRVANASALTGRHRDTVHRHLREVEELLGCRIEERSADLLWALRLRTLLDDREQSRRAFG